MTRAAVLGAGAVGSQVVQYLLASDSVEQVLVRDYEPDRLARISRDFGSRVEIENPPFQEQLDVDAVVVASPRGTQVEAVATAISAGCPAVLVGDGLAETIDVLRLSEDAARAAVPVVVGSGFGPGFSCVLAAHGASWFESVDEIHVAKMGTGGPACALVHHRALSRRSYDWKTRNREVLESGNETGNWVRRPGGSGRELVWFPDPVGPRDCYRAALPDPVLLHHAMPDVGLITARMAATRRDRLTAPLPMLSPPHMEGGVGAVRVEIRGLRDGAQDVVVLGAVERPAAAAAKVAATTVEWLLADRHQVKGMVGLAEMVRPIDFLDDLAGRGLEAQIFEGERGLS